MLDLPFLLQLLTRLHVSVYHTFWNNEKWRLLNHRKFLKWQTTLSKKLTILCCLSNCVKISSAYVIWKYLLRHYKINSILNFQCQQNSGIMVEQKWYSDRIFHVAVANVDIESLKHVEYYLQTCPRFRFSIKTECGGKSAIKFGAKRRLFDTKHRRHFGRSLFSQNYWWRHYLMCQKLW